MELIGAPDGSTVEFPADWTVERLGDIGAWYSGGTPRMSEPSYWNGGIPWVSPKDMKSLHLRNAQDTVTDAAIGNGTRLVPAGTLLVVVRGMILAHSAPVALAARPLAFNQDIKALVPRPDVASEYVLQWLAANKSILLRTTSESTHGTKKLASDDLFALTIPLPPIPEQRAIAGALGDVDESVIAVERLIAKKRDVKQVAIQRLLTGAERLPSFSAQWTRRALAHAVEDLEAGVSVNSRRDGEGSPFYVLKTSAVARGKYLPTEIKPVASADLQRARLTVRSDTVIISRMNTPDLVGECGYVASGSDTVFLPDRLWMTRLRASTRTSA